MEGFAEVDGQIARRAGGHSGGTMAVLACAVGWELLIASVGDSLAVLDTGSEVLQVRGAIGAHFRISYTLYPANL